MAAKKETKRPTYVGPYENKARTANGDETNTAAFTAEQYTKGLGNRVYDPESGGYIYKDEPKAEDSDDKTGDDK